MIPVLDVNLDMESFFSSFKEVHGSNIETTKN